VRHALSTAALGQAAEAAVVALAIGGDEAAFSELVGRRQAWLRSLLRRLCRDHALADDLAQQVLLQAWRSLNKLRSVTAFGAWLRQLAINAWLNQLRAAPARMHAIDATANAVEVEETTTPTPGEALDLDRALALLARDERLCIVLAYNEGLSHSEISAATALPLGTVKSHIKRGAERLRTLLEAYQPIEGPSVEGNRHVR
jgi:RNA polymerase sigma factor (sigma-70 family)